MPTLAVSGLQGVTQPQSGNILKDVAGFSPVLHSKYTNNDFVLGFDKDNNPLVIAIRSADKKEWIWKSEIGLKDLADQAGIKVGIVPIEQKLLGNQKYLASLKKSSNLVLLEQGLHWKWLEPRQGQLDSGSLSAINRQLDALKQLDGVVVMGHPLIFAANNPDWLQIGNYTREQAIEILRSRITSMVGRFKGIVSEWVVVNEPYFKTTRQECGFDYVRPDFFYEKIGPEYIEIAFQAAREADPSAILIYNDTANHASYQCNSNGLYSKLTQENVARLKAKGLVDAVGMQVHIKAENPPNVQDVIRNMQSYGLPIYITEMDVDLSNVTGTPEERLAVQARIYADVVDATLKSGVCRSVGFYNMGDKNSWLVLYQNRPKADATLFDNDLNPKPAYFAVMKTLSQALTTMTIPSNK